MTPEQAARLVRQSCGNKAVRDIALDALAQPGVRVKRTKSGLRFLGPTGTAGMHMTMSDKRAALNMRAQMRRAGILA